MTKEVGSPDLSMTLDATNKPLDFTMGDDTNGANLDNMGLAGKDTQDGNTLIPPPILFMDDNTTTDQDRGGLGLESATTSTLTASFKPQPESLSKERRATDVNNQEANSTSPGDMQGSSEPRRSSRPKPTKPQVSFVAKGFGRSRSGKRKWKGTGGSKLPSGKGKKEGISSTTANTPHGIAGADAVPPNHELIDLADNEVCVYDGTGFFCIFTLPM